MRAVTIERILDHVEDFEDMLADFYQTCSRDNLHEGVRMLTEYMGRHSHHIRRFLNEMPPDIVSRILSIPLPYEPHFPGCEYFKRIELSADADADQVLDTAVFMDECLMQLYRQVVRQPVEHHVRELFENLIQLLEQDEIHLKKIKAAHYF